MTYGCDPQNHGFQYVSIVKWSNFGWFWVFPISGNLHMSDQTHSNIGWTIIVASLQAGLRTELLQKLEDVGVLFVQSWVLGETPKSIQISGLAFCQSISFIIYIYLSIEPCWWYFSIFGRTHFAKVFAFQEKGGCVCKQIGTKATEVCKLARVWTWMEKLTLAIETGQVQNLAAHYALNWHNSNQLTQLEPGAGALPGFVPT